MVVGDFATIDWARCAVAAGGVLFLLFLFHLPSGSSSTPSKRGIVGMTGKGINTKILVSGGQHDAKKLIDGTNPAGGYWVLTHVGEYKWLVHAERYSGGSGHARTAEEVREIVGAIERGNPNHSDRMDI